MKQVSPQHAPKAAEGDVQARERDQKENADEQRLVIADPEGRGDDGCHRLGHPAEDQAIHQQAEVERAKAAQKCRGFAGVADFRELHIGEQSGTSPETGKQKHRHHAGEQEAPPDPVAGHSLGIHQSGDDQRRIGGKCRGDHRGPGEPPGNVAPGDEVVVHAAPGARAEVKTKKERDGQIRDDRRPVEREKFMAGQHTASARSETKFLTVCG